MTQTKKLLTTALIVLLCLSIPITLTKEPFAHATGGGITRVQGPVNNSSNTATLTITMSQTPALGNLLIACIGTYNPASTLISVLSISETGVSWVRIVNESYVLGYVDSEIWVGTVSSGVSTFINITLSGAAEWGATADICEYSGLLNIVDQTAISQAFSSSPSTGITTTTSQANELWVGCTVCQSYPQSSPTNGFTMLDGTVNNQTCVAYLENIVSTTGTANSGTTIVAGNMKWAGCIATFFVSAQVPRYNNLSVSSSLANNTVIFSSYWNEYPLTLSKYIFGTNNTGSWVNGTATAFSGTPAWANVTVTTLNPAIGSIVGYEYWANDSANNWVNTGIQTLTATGYYITVSNDSYSNISPTGLVAVDAGSYQAFTFNPINGSYTIQNVVINSTYQAATSSPYTFLNVQGNESISVSTSSAVYYINATSDVGSVITPSGINLVYAGGVYANFTCTAYPTYQIYNLAVNGTNLGPASGLDFMPTGNTTLYLTSISTSTGQSGGNNYIPPTQTPTPTVQPTPTPIATMPNSPLVDYGIVLIVGVLLIAIVVGYAQVHKKKTLSELFEAR